MALKKIRLELARNDEFPEGSTAHGYEFVAPLSDVDELSPEDWRAERKNCTVRRFWGEEDEESGHLAHVGRGWVFHYDGTDAEDNEPIFKLDRHSLKAGEYLSITEHDDVLRTFKVISVKPYSE